MKKIVEKKAAFWVKITKPQALAVSPDQLRDDLCLARKTIKNFSALTERQKKLCGSLVGYVSAAIVDASDYAFLPGASRRSAKENVTLAYAKAFDEYVRLLKIRNFSNTTL